MSGRDLGSHSSGLGVDEDLVGEKPSGRAARRVRLRNLSQVRGSDSDVPRALREALGQDRARCGPLFARNEKEREFARELGAVWAGDTQEAAPAKLRAIIDTTPVWRPAVEALGNLEPGGRLVINAMRKESADKEALLSLDYPSHLWEEKEVKSVANVSRSDVREFLRLAAEIPIRPEVQEYALEDANVALSELKARKIRGAKVLRIRA